MIDITGRNDKMSV